MVVLQLLLLHLLLLQILVAFDVDQMLALCVDYVVKVNMVLLPVQRVHSQGVLKI